MAVRPFSSRLCSKSPRNFTIDVPLEAEVLPSDPLQPTLIHYAQQL